MHKLNIPNENKREQKVVVKKLVQKSASDIKGSEADKRDIKNESEPESQSNKPDNSETKLIEKLIKEIFAEFMTIREKFTRMIWTPRRGLQKRLRFVSRKDF